MHRPQTRRHSVYITVAATTLAEQAEVLLTKAVTVLTRPQKSAAYRSIFVVLLVLSSPTLPSWFRTLSHYVLPTNFACMMSCLFSSVLSHCPFLWELVFLSKIIFAAWWEVFLLVSHLPPRWKRKILPRSNTNLSSLCNYPSPATHKVFHWSIGNFVPPLLPPYWSHVCTRITKNRSELVTSRLHHCATPSNHQTKQKRRPRNGQCKPVGPLEGHILSMMANELWPSAFLKISS